MIFICLKNKYKQITIKIMALSSDGGWLIHESKATELKLIKKSARGCTKGEIIYVSVHTAWDGVAKTRRGLMKAEVISVDVDYGWLRCKTYKKYLDICRNHWNTEADVNLSNGVVYTFYDGAIFKDKPNNSDSEKWSLDEISSFTEKMERIGSKGRTQWQILYGRNEFDD